MKRFIEITAIILLVAMGSCGQNKNQTNSLGNPNILMPAPAQQQAVEWPNLPADKAQPWEKLDGAGRVISSINLQSQFVPGVERFLEAGDVTDLGEASAFTSGSPGGENVSWAIYRIPMGADQPGTIAADVNLRLDNNGEQSAYYIGVGDYAANTWHWRGPFSVSHVRFNVPYLAYTSALGNLMLAVVAYDGADFDLVGLGVNARDIADSAPPPVPSAPFLTPEAGGVLAEWVPVVADDLAGYVIYDNGKAVFNYVEGGTSVFIPASVDAYVTLSAVDVNGNESAQSDPAFAGSLAGEVPAVQLTASSPSGMRGDIISLTATGADSYDWDTDGDGTWDITDDVTGSAFAVTTNMGIIRPALRAHAAGDGFWMGAVSLIIAGNSRPVAEAFGNPAFGPAPLEVSFEGFAEDDDGTIAMYAWDFEGDGTYDYSDPQNANPPPHTYAVPGLYNPKFRVTDNEGSWDVDTVAIQVLPGDNTAPVAALNALPNSGYVPLEVILDATGSFDPDAGSGDYIARYTWDIDGDTAFEELTYTPTLAVVYDEPGVFNATVHIEDSFGASDEASAVVTVNILGNSPPTADISANTYSGNAPLQVGFNASLSYDSDGQIVRYDWDFNGDGTYEDYGGSWDPVYEYKSGGTFAATLRVTDNDGAQAIASVAIDVNALPIAYFGYWPSDPDTDEVIHFDASDSYDSDGSIADYEWDFDGDHSFNEFGDEANARGDSTPQTSYEDAGNYDVYLRVTDNKGAQDVEYRTIHVQGWWLFSPDTTEGSGVCTSLAVVDGYPAIAYMNATDFSLYFVRATDEEGKAWGTPVLVDSAGDVGWYASLVIVNGNPAISYYDITNYDLKFVRATEKKGVSWGTPLTVDSAGDVGMQSSLAVVNGNPAISYLDNSGGFLKYVRANNPDGTSWNTPIVVDGAGLVGAYSSLAVVNGNPAVSYYNFGMDDLLFVRANDVDGASWGAPATVDGAGGLDTCLLVVEGNPAISYYDEANGYLKYVRSLTPNGSGWSQRIILDSIVATNAYTSMAVIDGYPTISYYDNRFYHPKLICASSKDGSTWFGPTTIDFSCLGGEYCSLREVNGYAAVSYYDGSNERLKFGLRY